MLRTRTTAFTLIELLIVIAIIAILALIAVPNFLEAQMRAKVTRVHTDFKAIHTAMEAYYTDHGDYPQDEGGFSWIADYAMFVALTTPIAYLTYIPTNPFFEKGSQGQGNYSYWRNHSRAGANAPWENHNIGVYYSLTSAGPDQKWTLSPRAVWIVERPAQFLNDLYNPTNGTASHGDLHLSNRGIST